MHPNTAALIERTKASRQSAGLLVEWIIPAANGQPSRNWSAYASSYTVKARWISEGQAKGWQLVVDREALRSEYLALVGYDVFADDPSLSTEDASVLLAEVRAAAAGEA